MYASRIIYSKIRIIYELNNYNIDIIIIYISTIKTNFSEITTKLISLFKHHPYATPRTQYTLSRKTLYA